LGEARRIKIEIVFLEKRQTQNRRLIQTFGLDFDRMADAIQIHK
jgi:hypothetical protein